MKKILIAILLIQNICFAQMTAPVFTTKKAKGAAIVATPADKVIFYGLTALNSSTQTLADNITATGRLAVQLQIIKALKVGIGVNLLNANPTRGIKKDSVDFNSLMFPETGNYGFLFNPSWEIKSFNNGTNRFYLDGTYAYRRIAIDSPNVSFKINSVNLGLRYQWYYPKDDDNLFVFSLIGYWNFFNIPDEDVKKFDLLIKDPLFLQNNKNAEIYSIGLKTEIQYNSFLFFADLRRNLNTKNLDDDNPFKGTKFNIGFATSFKLKSF
jgi:hypothetical protein